MKKKADATYTHRVTTYITPPLAKELMERAERRGLNESVFLREMIIQKLEEQE